ncbi:hypothetical protein [Halosimplex amylolyticum]|uniref:hypothetical protein n=1 Tax=Halosimplex amylolyticum TaxID=3396616 RepID=UPI003F55A902
MAKFTLLEVHLDDAEFTANAPYSDAESAETGGLGGLPFGADEDEGVETATEDDGSNPFGIVLTFAGMILAVVAIRRLLGGSGEPALEMTEAEDAESSGLLARF